MKWSVDNQYRLGNVVSGRYVLLKDGHEVAYGLDAPELRKVANMLNMATPEMERKALHMLCSKWRAA